MISFRKYLGIAVMMAMLFAIFLFSVIVNEQESYYDINEYADGERLSGENRWTVAGEEELVLLIGTENEALISVVEQWCLYTKRELLLLETPDAYLEAVQTIRKPVLILLNGEQWASIFDKQKLLSLTEQNVPLVFCGIPPASTIVVSRTLCDVLGIRSVMPNEAELTGVQLYEGFFLGGGVTYEAVTQDDKKRQDMDLTVPWYLLANGTKTYMAGIMEEEEVREAVGLSADAEGVLGYLPKLIWRNSYKNCKVFVVNGDFMSTLAGLGILSSFCYEIKEYELYPVVNAQNVLIHNYPNLAEENESKFLEVYSRSPRMVFQGIMWPSVSAMAKANELKLTCFFNPQYDYTDEILPKEEDIPFYLKQLREIKSEAGMALSYSEDTSFATMLAEDTKFYESLDSQYCYQTVFAEEKDFAAIENSLGGENMLKQVVTIGSEYQPGEQLISYFTDEITLQRTTGTARTHSYMDNFVVRSIQTALLYSNVLVDLEDAVRPQEKEDEWQILYDDMASNVSTYWGIYRDYEQTTLSESDKRVRTLLNLDYSHERKENEIVLQVENADNACFLLRTHQEKIVEITGGEFQKLEEDAYLVTVYGAEAVIRLEQVSLEEQRK